MVEFQSIIDAITSLRSELDLIECAAIQWEQREASAGIVSLDGREVITIALRPAPLSATRP